MNIYTQIKRLNQELIILDDQIDKTISDIGRLSSYNQSSTEILSKIKFEKVNFLRSLMDKRTKLINHLEK